MDDYYPPGREPYAPYQQSRSALRKRFGARKIGGPATQSPRDQMRGLGIAADPVTGQRSDADWSKFFAPSRGLMGRRAGASQVAPLIQGVPVHGVPLQQPMTANAGQPLPARAPLPTRPTDYLSSAFEKSTLFWNQNAASISTPKPGQIQSGTKFQNTYGTGSVSSESENRLKRLMRQSRMA